MAATCAPTRSARSAARSSTVVRSRTSWRGLARPSCRTATASPPQTSFAPLSPKRRQRRRTRSEGRPSGSASHPSMGSTANRLPTVCAPVEPSTNENGVHSGPCGSTASSTPSWSAMPSTASRARSSSIVRRRFTWTISLAVTATTPSAARCRRGPRGRCRDVGVRRAASCPSRSDRDAAGTAPRRVGTRGPAPGTRTRRGTAGGR